MSQRKPRDPIADIREHVEELSVSHAWWADREGSRAALLALAGALAVCVVLMPDFVTVLVFVFTPFAVVAALLVES